MKNPFRARKSDSIEYSEIQTRLAEKAKIRKAQREAEDQDLQYEQVQKNLAEKAQARAARNS